MCAREVGVEDVQGGFEGWVEGKCGDGGGEGGGVRVRGGKERRGKGEEVRIEGGEGWELRGRAVRGGVGHCRWRL